MTVKVRILEKWNGYNAGSQVIMQEKAYYRHKATGVQLQLIAGRPEPLIIDDEAEELEQWKIADYINEEE